MDSVGEWATSTLGHGRGNEMRILKELPSPLPRPALFRPSPTSAGSRSIPANTSSWSLAPYGRPMWNTIRKNLIDLRDDGSFPPEHGLLRLSPGCA
ncbi:MAG: hypothetical protein U1G05_17770 [Kiritimatiellia bacterium]